MFKKDQRQQYKELDGKMNGQTQAPDSKGSTELWSTLWSEPVENNRDPEWLKKVKTETHQDTKKM